MTRRQRYDGGEDNDKGGDDSGWLGGKAGCNWWDSRRLGWRGFELLRLTTASSIMCVLVWAVLYQGIPKPFLIVSMLRILWMFTRTTFLRQPVLPLIDNQVYFTSDCLASLSNLDDLVQTYLSYTKYTFWLLSASVHCKSWTAAYEASTGPHEYSSVTVSSYLLLTSLYKTHNTHIRYMCMCIDSGYCILSTRIKGTHCARTLAR